MFDANEAEAWMSEQELYMMVEDRGKVRLNLVSFLRARCKRFLRLHCIGTFIVAEVLEPRLFHWHLGLHVTSQKK